MSVTIVTCPRCSAQFKLRDPKLAGKKIKCRKCQSPFQVAAPKDKLEDDIVDDFTDDGGGETEFDDESPAPAPRRGARQPRPLGKPLGARKPVKKKKREVEEEEEEDESDDGSQKKIIIAVISVGALVAIGGIVFAVMTLIGGGGGGSAEEVPQNFVRYDEPGAALMFEYPEGWAAKHGGGTGGIPGWIKIEKDDVTIVARDSVSGQSIGVLANPSGAHQDGKVPDELDPVHAVHIFQREKLMREEDGYEESPPEVIETKMGESRIAEFKKPQGLFGTKYGYRATLPPSTKQFTVTCSCSKSEFERLKDTFRRVIASMTFGRGG